MGWVCIVGSMGLYIIRNGSLIGLQSGDGTLGIIVRPMILRLFEWAIKIANKNERLEGLNSC